MAPCTPPAPAPASAGWPEAHPATPAPQHAHWQSRSHDHIPPQPPAEYASTAASCAPRPDPESACASPGSASDPTLPSAHRESVSGDYATAHQPTPRAADTPSTNARSSFCEHSSTSIAPAHSRCACAGWADPSSEAAPGNPGTHALSFPYKAGNSPADIPGSPAPAPTDEKCRSC